MLEKDLLPIMDRVCEKLGRDSKAARLFMNCYPNTLSTTTKISGDEVFVFTGDIHAMWLRDSSAQVRHYLPVAKEDPSVADLLVGLSKRQMKYILLDAYANAFNESPDWGRYRADLTTRNAFVYERKYEIDSLCYPIRLAYLIYRETGRTDHLDETFHRALLRILDVFETEQHHEKSLYHFERTDCPPSDTLPRQGKGSPVAYTGMTWSGFRPSDDACRYGYLIPSNMFASVILKEAAEIVSDVFRDQPLSVRCFRLSDQIREGIERYGIAEHPEYGKVYTYEADGMGHYVLMDDANVPSLLSIPYLGYLPCDNLVYQNTRRLILSKVNPYYYEGRVLKGIGSPHTPPDHIWPIALSMQGLTSNNKEEVQEVFDLLMASDADTFFMHEGVHKDDPYRFTRPWFAWSNSLFSEFILHYIEICS
ncbi:MAG: glycoside hydrolase family 125 protein [Firmicutes bacterium]|nr:glycoside hydrolase family 125 protein [Bacillota bacterium]